MSERPMINPLIHPELAAQEALLRLIDASTTEFAHGSQGEGVAESMIAIHRKLTEYYRSLSARQ